MTELPIYNCHIHTFTTRQVPRDFLKLLWGPVVGPIAGQVLSVRPLAHLVIRLAPYVNPWASNDLWERWANLFSTGDVLTQREVFLGVEKQYPPDTVFVVLPMDMAFFKLGPVPENIDWQHEDLLALAAEFPGRIVPFYAVDPRRDDVIKRARQFLASGKFRGVKIYPNGGYYPTDDKLMGVYAICEEHGLPVTAHCGPYGVWQYGLTVADRVRFSHPSNYEAILTKFPKLRLCLAHFGGSSEWDKQLKSKTDRAGDDRSWVRWICDLIRDGAYPNLYTDISYLIFQSAGQGIHVTYMDYLKVLLDNPRLQGHVLFGSDYYMVEQEPMTEKEVSIALRSHLGEDLFFQIAHHNPRRWLGMESGARGAGEAGNKGSEGATSEA